jgi:hypothetical protein
MLCSTFREYCTPFGIFFFINTHSYEVKFRFRSLALACSAVTVFLSHGENILSCACLKVTLTSASVLIILTDISDCFCPAR